MIGIPQFADLEKKDSVLAGMSEFMRKNGTTDYIIASEARMSTPRVDEPFVPASEHPSRREVIMIVGGDSEGLIVCWTADIVTTEGDDKKTLKPLEQMPEGMTVAGAAGHLLVDRIMH